MFVHKLQSSYVTVTSLNSMKQIKWKQISRTQVWQYYKWIFPRITPALPRMKSSRHILTRNRSCCTQLVQGDDNTTRYGDRLHATQQDFCCSLHRSNSVNNANWCSGGNHSVAAIDLFSKRHNIQLCWNYFATSHGKGPVDGVGGTLKRVATDKVRTRQCTINNMEDFVTAVQHSSIRVTPVSAVTSIWRLMVFPVSEYHQRHL